MQCRMGNGCDLRIGKGPKLSCLGFILNHDHKIYLEVLTKTMSFCQDGQLPVLELKSGLPENEAVMLNTQLLTLSEKPFRERL
jgi:hypothetical protein